MIPVRSIVLLVAAALVVAACSPAAPPKDTTSTTVTTSSTAAPATSATTTTTTTPVAPRLVRAFGDLPDPILDAVAALYSWLADERNPRPPAPAAMTAALEGAGHPVGTNITASGVVHELAACDEIAVVHVGEDIVFLVADARPWRVAGVILAGQQPWLGDSPRLLLVLGSDARPGQNQRRLRADSIHIVGVAPDLESGSVVGFPRDSWVAGPVGNDKFTNIMAGRGPDVMLETTEALTGLDIDGYVVTGFVGFEGLIRDLGGLTIDLPRSIRSGIEGWQDYPAGLQKLGPTALLRLARIRKTLNGGDFARSANHGLIMLAGMVAVQEMGVDELPALLDILLEHAWTDLGTEDLLTMAATVYVLTPEEMINMVLPGTVGTAGTRSVVFLDPEAEDIYLDLADGVIDEEPPG